MELYNTRSWYVLAAAILISVIIYFNLGWFGKYAVERLGSQVLGTRVSIGKMVVDAKAGTAIAEDIKIYNPSDYRKYKPYAVTVKKVNIDTKELRRGLIVFENSFVEGVDVYLVADEKNSNFAIFRDNIRSYMDKYRANYDEDDVDAPDVMVNKLKLVQAKLHPVIIRQTYVLGQERLADIDTVEIPDIEMDSIGEDTKGIRARKAIDIIWHELTNAAIKATSNKGLFSNVPPHQMDRIMDTTKLPESVGAGSDKTLKELFGRRY